MPQSDILNEIDIDSNHFDTIYPNLLENRTNQYFNTSQFNQSYNEWNGAGDGNFSLVHANIRSLSANGDEFAAYMETLDVRFNAICFSETWLGDEIPIINKFAGYRSYHSVRSGRRGGGVSIYVDERFSSVEITNLSCNNSDIECVVVEITIRSKKICLISCYRPPNNSNYDDFQNQLLTKLTKASKTTADVILCGDLNIDLLKIESDASISNFYDSLSSHSLLPMISKPTRITDDTFSLIDNIFVTNPSQIHSGILNFDITDHFPIFITYKDFLNNISPQPEIIEYRIINEYTLQLFYDNLSKTSFDEITTLSDCNEAINKLDRLIMTEYDNACPKRKKKVNYLDKSKPWISKEILEQIKKRQHYYNLLKQNWMTTYSYNRFRNSVTSEIRNAKKTYYDKLFLKVRNDVKKTWNIINKIIRPDYNKTNFIDSIIFNNEQLKDHSSIANAFNNYFSSIGSNISRSFPDSTDIRVPSSIQNSFFFRQIFPNEILKIIMSLKNKSTSTNVYPVIALKRVASIVAPVLASLINKSLACGTFPDYLKVARVVPIHKGGDKEAIGNYRPISILPTISKIYEKIVKNQLVHFLEKFNLFDSCQYGFRQNRSTTQAILSHLQYIYDGLDSGQTVVSFYLDFSKAFDCIDHEILFEKLACCGIRGVTLEWFKSYLTGRNQYVSVNGVNSNILPITSGVPQGSILGPILFLLFINDFSDSNPFFKFTLFADDSTLSCRFDTDDPELI